MFFSFLIRHLNYKKMLRGRCRSGQTSEYIQIATSTVREKQHRNIAAIPTTNRHRHVPTLGQSFGGTGLLLAFFRD